MDLDLAGQGRPEMLAQMVAQGSAGQGRGRVTYWRGALE